MENNKIILTEEGKLNLEKRRYELNNVLIPQVVERIKAAKEQGDLSENAEYTAARDEQARLNGELQDIEYKLKYGEVQTFVDNGTVQVGSVVTYKDLEINEEFTFSVVGTAEADIMSNKISNESPIGKALYGRKQGDVVTVLKPKGGSYNIEILTVEGN
jgi:transcription elongation factor GreA